MTVIFNLLFY